ncbi:MAG: hypothetical protein MJH09_06430 [Cetobacterium sp.]|nr:hypothetical protein [Cetobacterium sp.]
MDKFIELDLQGKLQYIKATLINKNNFNLYQLYYNSLLEKDIFLENEIFEINQNFKEKLRTDGEYKFLIALENVGFFNE